MTAKESLSLNEIAGGANLKKKAFLILEYGREGGREGRRERSFLGSLFLIRKKHRDGLSRNSSLLVFFHFQASLFHEDLDLGFLACQDVEVSFAAVSKDAMSQYSPAADICVHGGKCLGQELHVVPMIQDPLVNEQ